MIVEILFFILIILIVILFLCIRKVYTGGFLPRSAGLQVGDPDDNSIVFFEMSSMTDINKYIDIVTYKNLINEYSIYDSNLLNDREKVEVTEIDLFDDYNNRQYKTIRDWFTIRDDLKYECHNDFKWGNSAFSFICGKSRTDYAGSVKQNLKEIINDYVELDAKINKESHVYPCLIAKCIYCLTKDTNTKYLIYLYDAYRNSNIYPSSIKIIKDEFTKLQKNIRDTLFDINKSNILQNGANTFINEVVAAAGGFTAVNGNNENCSKLSYIIIMFYLCDNNMINDGDKLDMYYRFFSNSIDSNLTDDIRDDIIRKYTALFGIVRIYFPLNRYIIAQPALQLTTYQKFINDIIDIRDIILDKYNKIIKYYDIVNKISVIIYYNLHINPICELLKVIDVNKDPVPEEIPSNIRPIGLDGKKSYDNEYIHKYIMYILFLIAKNNLAGDIQNVNNPIAQNITLDNIIGNKPLCDNNPNSNNNYFYKNNILNVNNDITLNPTSKYNVISDESDCIWKGNDNNPLPYGNKFIQRQGRGRGRGRGQQVRGRGVGFGYGQGRGVGLGHDRSDCIINGTGKYQRVLYKPHTCVLTTEEKKDLDLFIKNHAMKITKILEPHINRAIKYFEADDRRILLKDTDTNPGYGFHAIQKAYYKKHINTFYFMRQTLIIYPESFFGTNSDNKFNMKNNIGGCNKFTVNCNSYDRYRVKNTQTDSKKYDDLDIFYHTSTNDPNDNKENKFKLSLITEKPINSNVMALPFIPIIFNDINVDEKITDDDRKYIIDKYYDMDLPFLGQSSSNIIKFICEHNINFVLYVGFGKGEFHLPNNINTNMIKMFGKDLGMSIEDIEKIKEVLQDDIEIYTRLFNRLFSIIPRFFRGITTNAYYVKNEYSKDTIDNFIQLINPPAQIDMILRGDNIKIIDDKGIINDGANVTITMNISGTPENFTIKNYNVLLSENEYDKLPSDYLITPRQGHNATIIKKLKVTKNDDSPIIDKFTYIGTNMPIGDEIIERKKREPKQIYGVPQTSEFSFPAQISQQKSTPIEYSLCYSPEEYKTSEENFSCSVKEFNLSSSSEYISSPAINESEYAICYTNNDSSSEKMQYYTFEEMQSLCDSTGILYSTKLFAVESSEPVDDYERIRISQELHKLDQNIPEIKMPKDLKILKHDINKKNKIRIKKVIRGLNGKVLSIDDVHTIYINIE